MVINRFLLVLVFLLTSGLLFPQSQQTQTEEFGVSDFVPIMSFLSSDWMEGREAGSKGSYMAADYIASMMQLNGLQPYGDILSAGHSEEKSSRSYFQEFDIIRYKTDEAALSLITKTGDSRLAFHFNYSIDFTVDAGTNSLESEAPLVFIGYGISTPGRGYDDYKGLNVKGKIVVIMKGFPGHQDTASLAYRKLGKSFEKEYAGIETKKNEAMKRGAIAVLELTSGNYSSPFANKQIDLPVVDSAINSEKENEPAYEEDFCMLPGNKNNPSIPLFRLGLIATEKLFEGTELNLMDAEFKAAEKLMTSSFPFKNKSAGFTVKVRTDILKVRNVLGFIKGKDTTRNIVIGAHYDHLGMRNGIIYPGADDNASGVAGLLSIAEVWCHSKIHPPCNIVFASWSAEEKGMLGSNYFVMHTQADNRNTLVNINADMISRSADTDTAHQQLSIGIPKGNNDLREIVRQNNNMLPKPFDLDLWDASGEGGSDYAPFASRNIPVITFFSGYHEDYHSPRDKFNKTDPAKMKSILWLVNKSLLDIIETLYVHTIEH